MTICQIVEYNNPEKDVVGVHINAEGKDPKPSFYRIYDVLKEFYHKPEENQFLDGYDSYEKKWKDNWFYKLCHDFDLNPKTHRTEPTDIDFRMDLVYLGVKNVKADSKEGAGRAYPLLMFGLYFKEPAESIDRCRERDNILNYLKMRRDFIGRGVK